MENSDDLRPLVQAPMESPLNRAHTFSRRAEMLTKSKRYDEAISCHSKAAECLLQAMKSCNVKTVLDSMALQHQSYLSQMERLGAKAQLLDLMDNTHKTTATVSQSTQTDSVHSVCSDRHMKIDEEIVYEILRENEELMKGFANKLGDKAQFNEVSGMSDKSYRSVNLCESDSSDGLGSEKSQNGWKLVSNIQSTSSSSNAAMDSVLQMNDRLSQCVVSLLRELSSTHAEKKEMEERLCKSDDALTPLSEPGLQFSCPSFPPLESLYPEVGHFSPPK